MNTKTIPKATTDRRGFSARNARDTVITAGGLWVMAMGWLLGSLGLELGFVGCLIVATALLTLLAKFRNPFHMMWMIGHYTFCLMPTVVGHLVQQRTSLEVASVCTMLSFLALICSRTPKTVGRDDEMTAMSVFRPGLLTLALVSAASIGVVQITTGDAFIYVFPLIIVVFLQYRVGRSIGPIILAFTIVLISFYIYTRFYWNGFGRVLLAGMLTVPILSILYRLRLDVIKGPFLVMSCLGGILGTFLRFGGTDLNTLFVNVFRDSSFAPMQTGQQVFNVAESVGGRGVGGILDQYILLAVGAFPRILWTEKPFGFGFQFTLDNLDPSYILAGHSIAASYIGEHVYYLGPVYGIFSAALSVVIVARGFVFLSRPQFLGGTLAHAVTIFIPTYYWGGMASFAQRFEIGAAAIALYLLATWALVEINRRRTSARVVTSPGHSSRSPLGGL